MFCHGEDFEKILREGWDLGLIRRVSDGEVICWPRSLGCWHDS
jgi:hypothetical protein